MNSFFFVLFKRDIKFPFYRIILDGLKTFITKSLHNPTG